MTELSEPQFNQFQVHGDIVNGHDLELSELWGYASRAEVGHRHFRRFERQYQFRNRTLSKFAFQVQFSPH